MRTVGRWLVAGWLLTALGVPGSDGRLPGFPAWTAPISLLALTVAALVRPAACVLDLRPTPAPQRYRVATQIVGYWPSGGRGEQEAGFGLRQAPDD
jgi:hypothetical protein